MAVLELLMTTLGVPLGKFLLKNFLGDPADAVGGSLLDLAKGKIKSYEDQREAHRQFERIGERIVARLVPLFEQAEGNPSLNPEAVAHELAETLESRVSAEFFLTQDLDPARLSAAFRTIRPLESSREPDREVVINGRKIRVLPATKLSTDEIALYNRALDETVRYLVEVAAQLPKFEEKLAAVSLQRLGLIGSDIDEVLDRTQRIEWGVAELVRKELTGDEKAQRYEADYRQAVVRNLDYMELFGADIRPESRRHALSVAYVSLNVQHESREGESESLPVETVLARLRPGAGRLLIRGEAGSGKSTLFRWAALEAAALRAAPAPALLRGGEWEGAQPGHRKREARPANEPRPRVERQGEPGELSILQNLLPFLRRPRPSEPEPRVERQGEPGNLSIWRNRVPFLLRLRHCEDGKLPKPDEFPLHVAKELSNPPTEWVTSILRSGRGLVLLDGADEIPNLHREHLWSEINAIIGAYPDNYYLLSTRPAAVPAGWLSGLGFHEGWVDPMSATDKAQFIQKWHEAVARELERQGRADPDLPKIATELIEKLPDHPPISRLAATPLLCAMICALHRDRNQKLPESQPELCEAICHMLLHRRERESGLNVDDFPSCYRELSYEQKRAIVQDIAHYMVRNDESVIDDKQAERIVGEALRFFPQRFLEEGIEVLRSLVERSGVLRESRPGAIEFLHNTIKEYLAAERFVDDGDLGLLSHKYREPTWQLVILFAASTRKRGFATELIRRIITVDPRSDNAEAWRARQLFALRCGAMALYLDPQLKVELAAMERSLFPPRNLEDAEALATGGDTTMDYLHYQEEWEERQAAACVRALRLIGTPKAHRCLRGYLKDRRQTVVSELAQAVNPLEIEAIQGLISRGERLPVNIQIRDLSPFTGLNSFQSLYFTGMPVSDLSPLASLTRLQSLYLEHTHVTDLSPLTGLTGLQSLDLSGTLVSDLAPLASLTRLQSLQLTGTRVTNLSPLASLNSLKSLDLTGTRVSNLSPLTSLTRLQTLNLTGTQVTDLSPLAGLTGLQTLDLSGTIVSDLSPLAGLKVHIIR